VKRLLFAFTALAVVGMVCMKAKPAAACVPDPSYDPVAASDVIVAGRFTGWQAAPDIDISPEAEVVRVQMDVERVFKGYAEPRIDVVATMPSNNLANWRGENPSTISIGSCPSVFGWQNPTGTYAVIGLVAADDGSLISTDAFFEGSYPSGADYEDAVTRLLTRLPSGGGRPGSESAFPTPVAMLALLGPLVVLAGAAFVWRRGERHNG
jgi:hypothetical protein